MFQQNRARFAPKFNGYCAFAAGHHNAKVPANADTFKFYNGELLVFWDRLFVSFTRPQAPRPAEYGVDGCEGEEFQTLQGMLLTPLRLRTR